MATARPIVVGTRGSQLALRQTEEVLEKLRALYPKRQFRVSVIKTHGDVAVNVPISGLGKEAFTKEIDVALLKGEIDFAVHSLKDMTYLLPRGLVLAALPSRQDPRDVLVSRTGAKLEELPPGAKVGTGSPRRAVQLRALRSDLRIEPIRGNVDTRLRKTLEGGYDAVLLAAAGLLRLGLGGEITQYLEPHQFIPAVGQGVLAVEAREDDTETRSILSAIDDSLTRTVVMAERAFLEAIGGSCKLPIAAFAEMEGNMLKVTGMVASDDGSLMFRDEVIGEVSHPAEAGKRLAQRLVRAGARSLLAQEGT